jgi:type III pantothenate kinase
VKLVFKKKQMILLIDIGNTRLKWALENEGLLGGSQAIGHQQIDFIQQLKTDWSQLAIPNQVAISSVGSDGVKKNVITIIQAFWKGVTLVIARSSTKSFGVNNHYLFPEKLGVDRWLCLIKSYHHYQQAFWVIDCGTAITMDFVDASGQHHGGVISAGLQLMRTALSTQTAALNFKGENAPLGLSNQTDNAIFSGTLYAVIGLIEQLLTQYSQPSKLILTGGAAGIIAQHLSRPTQIESDLVLQGLALYTQKTL